jgi:hypothetical protein
MFREDREEQIKKLEAVSRQADSLRLTAGPRCQSRSLL